MANIIIIVILLIMVFLAIRFIVREKKRGRKCIGCPYSENCSKGKEECRD